MKNGHGQVKNSENEKESRLGQGHFRSNHEGDAMSRGRGRVAARGVVGSWEWQASSRSHAEDGHIE